VTWSPVAPNPNALAALDPYLEFAEETSFAYFFAHAEADPSLPLIIELQEGRTAQQFAGSHWAHEPWLQVPPAYRRPPAGLRETRYCTANVRQEFFDRLASGELRKWVKRVALSLPVQTYPSDELGPIQIQNLPPLPGVVVIGVIDDGLAFANAAFRNGTQSRIEYLWRQDVPGNPVSGFGYGSELQRIGPPGPNGIETELADATYGAFVDEDQVYRATGHIDFRDQRHKSVAQRGAHGTHVMHAASRLGSTVAPHRRPIIGVQLPNATTADTSGGSLARHVLDGLRYIVDRADRLAKRLGCGPLPVVVNISYGLIAGPHDGSSILEEGMDELIRMRRTRAKFSIVLPAGNSHLSRCHAEFKPQKQPREINWQVQPEDRTPSFVEIWLPRRRQGRCAVEVQVVTPTGAASAWVREGQVHAWQPHNDVLAKVVYFNGVPGGRARNMILVAVAPTATLDPVNEIAPAGRWRIRVRLPQAAKPVDETVHAWIQRDDTPLGYPPRGRQSYFDDPLYTRYDNLGPVEEDDGASYVTRNATLNAIATGFETIVIGGYVARSGCAARYSARGYPIRPARGAPNPDGPDGLAVSSDSRVRLGVIAAGTRSSSRVIMPGTSVAAPQITQIIADRMDAGLSHGRNALSAIAEVGLPPHYGPPPSVDRGGRGRVRYWPIVER
jgi:hypothetical protein